MSCGNSQSSPLTSTSVALAFFKFSILHDAVIDFAPWVLAAVKAAITAKFMLIGRALHLGERLNSYPLVVPTICKSAIFVILVTVLTIIEEVVVAHLHGRPLGAALAEIGGGSSDQRIATAIILLLIFIPYFAVRSLGELVGNRLLVRAYFEPRGR
jgi:hypothetical protein